MSLRKQVLNVLGVTTLLFLATSVVAHADTIDDFVLTGDGHTVSFSLPSTYTTGNHPHFASIAPGVVAATVDGSAGYTIGSTFYVPDFLLRNGADFSITPGLDGKVFTTNWILNGPSMVQYLISSNPAFVTLQFVPGTYTLRGFYTSLSDVPPNTLFTLSITPETAAPSAIPEPSTLVLLSTGALGLATRLRRRT